MRRSEQRRAAVIALYQHDLTGSAPVRRRSRRATNDFVRALAAAAIEHREELDELIDSHAHGWSVERIQPLERSILRVALVEMLYPRRSPRDAPIPAEGAIEEAVESAKVFCGADAPGFVNGVLAAVLREVRENAHSPMNSVERLDEMITRLERAAEQLRSGELSPDAAAGMVEDCAALATQAASELEQLIAGGGRASRSRARTRSSSAADRAAQAWRPAIPITCARRSRATCARMHFSEEPLTERARGGDALLAAGGRQADPPGAQPRHRPRARHAPPRGPAARRARSS